MSCPAIRRANGASSPKVLTPTLAMPKELARQRQSSNSWHALILLAGMTGILVLNGFLLFGTNGIWIALGLAVASALFSQQIGPRMVLRLYKARPILNHAAPELYAMFDELVSSAQLRPSPGLFYVPSKIPNAFAVGHDRSAAIAVTDGLLRVMNPRELKGVLAHEMAHLQNRDTRVMGLADTLSRVTVLLSRIGLLLIFLSLTAWLASGLGGWLLLCGTVLFLSPTFSLLLQFALSRSREFNADLGAVALTGDPYGLASALDKLDRLSDHHSFWQRMMSPERLERQPGLLRTHPDMEQRIKILLELVSPAVAAGYQRHPHQRLDARNSASRERLVIRDQPRITRTPRYHILSGIIR